MRRSQKSSATSVETAFRLPFNIPILRDMDKNLQKQLIRKKNIVIANN